MKKSIYPTFLLFLILNDVFAQRNVIYRENFENNKNNWELYNDKDFKVQISKGKLHMQKLELNRKSNGCLWYQKEIPGFHTAKNFSITFFAKILSLDDEFKAVDFQWGKLSDADTSIYKKFSLYQMIIKPADISLANFNRSEGWTYFDRYSNGGVGGGAQTGSLFKTNRYNKYEIQQKEGIIYFRLNDKLVYQRKAPPITGSEIGIQQCVKSEWQINKIIIRQE